ncbi:MAG: MarR family transcriptional regulator [Anaerolineales bacterium]
MPTHYTGTPEETLALNTFIKLTRATESLLARLNQRGTHGDLTPTQFGVLETLHHLGSMPPCELSTKLLTSSGNLTFVLDNLEKRGLVHRERNPEDRRSIIIHLTPQGEDLIASLFPAHAQAIAEELRVLTPEEQQTLGDLCRTLGRGTA